MDTLLIAGVDSIVGVNLAAHFAGRCRVIGLGLNEHVSLDGCHTCLCPTQGDNEILEWVESCRPDRLVYCGPAAASAWDGVPGMSRPDSGDVEIAGRWAAAARDYGAQFTLISSDAVFTGPWIFHDEQSSCRCRSAPARAIRRIEKISARLAPGALIIRTNAFGWSHNDGWMERILAALDVGQAGPYDFQRHATPILATDLAAILEKAWEARLDGLYHVAGAERINPNRFVHRLADEFDLPAPAAVDGNRLLERPAGFGCGETSLHTTRIRQALDLAMPTVDDALQRFREQKLGGYADSLKGPMMLEKAA